MRIYRGNDTLESAESMEPNPRLRPSKVVLGQVGYEEAVGRSYQLPNHRIAAYPNETKAYVRDHHGQDADSAATEPPLR